MFRRYRSCAHSTTSKTLLRVIALIVLAAAPVSSGLAADVAVAIRIDADLVEVVRGFRRAEGLDPPDAAADQRLAAVLVKRQRPRSPLPLVQHAANKFSVLGPP